MSNSEKRRAKNEARRRHVLSVEEDMRRREKLGWPHDKDCVCAECRAAGEWSPEEFAAAVALFALAVVAVILLWAYARQLPLGQ